MITDKETNFVYLSSLIKELEKYAPFWERLEKILIENKIGYGFIENTRDIWCRDYMPIQIDEKNFVQFDYSPDYCKSDKHSSLVTNPSEVKLRDKINSKKIELNIDGGNIVKSSNSVILTEKVFKDNSTSNKDTIVSRLKEELKVENIHFIPVLPFDYTGHADGMVRFLNDKDLLVADYSSESKTWCAKMKKALEKTGLKIVDFPSEIVDEKNDENDYTAKGVYINFMHINDLIILPQFGLKTDNQALDYTKTLFPDCKVIPINTNEIAMYGGVLNCITWNIKL